MMYLMFVSSDDDVGNQMPVLIACDLVSARSRHRQTEDERFSQERLISTTETQSKPTKSVVGDAPVHRRTFITQQKMKEHGGAPSCPKCEGHREDDTEACRKRFDDIEAAEAEAAARAAPAVDIPEALVGGPEPLRFRISQLPCQWSRALAPRDKQWTILPETASARE